MQSTIPPHLDFTIPFSTTSYTPSTPTTPSTTRPSNCSFCRAGYRAPNPCVDCEVETTARFYKHDIILTHSQDLEAKYKEMRNGIPIQGALLEECLCRVNWLNVRFQQVRRACDLVVEKHDMLGEGGVMNPRVRSWGAVSKRYGLDLEMKMYQSPGEDSEVGKGLFGGGADISEKSTCGPVLLWGILKD